MRLLCLMRIAVISVFPPYRGGIAQFNASMCEAFESEGHALLRVNFSRQYPRLLFPGKSQLEEGLNELENPLLDSLNPISWSKTADFVAEFSPDLVVVPFWQPLLLPALTTTIKRIKTKAPAADVIGLLHNATSHESQTFAAYLVRRFLCHLDGAWTLSEAVAAHPVVTGKLNRTKVLFHPVYNHFPDLRNQSESREKLALPCEADAHVILFFGLIRAYKGLEVLIEALPMMQSTGKPVHLVIAGECYEDWTKYEEAIELLNLDCLVHIHAKFIANEDVPYFFGAADLVCLPYRSASQSGVTAIAIQYGKPVVASAVGGLVEYFKDNSLGTLCEPNDPEALASAVLKQLRAPALDAIELESVQRRFSWKAFAQVALSQEEATKA